MPKNSTLFKMRENWCPGGICPPESDSDLQTDPGSQPGPKMPLPGWAPWWGGPP